MTEIKEGYKENQLLNNIKNLLIESRQQLQQIINTTIVQTYWQIGKIIVEDEQGGEKRAKYGTKQLESIAKVLIQEFGKGFEVSNLRKMRQFYIIFPIQDSVSPKLSWTHYRKLISIENETALPTEEELKAELLRERRLLR